MSWIAEMGTPRLSSINNRWRETCDAFPLFWQVCLLQYASIAQRHLHTPKGIPSAWRAALPIQLNATTQRPRNARRPQRAAWATASQVLDMPSTRMRATAEAAAGECTDR